MSQTCPSFITLDQYKTYRKSGQTDTGNSKDDYYQELICNGTNVIQQYLSRKIFAVDYVDWYSPVWTNGLLLNEYPIISLYGVFASNGNAITVSYTGDPIASISINNDSLVLFSTATNGTTTTTALDFETYPSSDTLVTEINSTSGWTATKNADCKSQFLTLGYYSINQNNSINIQYANTAIPAWYNSIKSKIELTSNIPYNYFNSQAPVLVSYRAGWEEIPAAIQQCALELCTLCDKSYGDLKEVPAGSGTSTVSARMRKALSYIDGFKRISL